MAYFCFPDDVVRDREGNPIKPNKDWVYQNPQVMTEQEKILQLEISKIVDAIVNGNTHPFTAKHDLLTLLCPKPEFIKIDKE